MLMQFRPPALFVVGVIETRSHGRTQKCKFHPRLEHRSLPDSGRHDDLRLLSSQDISDR